MTQTKIKLLLEKAERLKWAERYDEALEVYNRIMESDPANKVALEGIDDCQLMLGPEPVAQYMEPEPGNPLFARAYEKIRKAKTPWERRRAQAALCELGVRYTWEQLEPQESHYRKRAEQIVSWAIDAGRSGPPQEVFEQARKKLLELQPEGDIGWTWFGFKVIDDSLEQLREALEL